MQKRRARLLEERIFLLKGEKKYPKRYFYRASQGLFHYQQPHEGAPGRSAWPMALERLVFVSESHGAAVAKAAHLACGSGNSRVSSQCG